MINRVSLNNEVGQVRNTGLQCLTDSAARQLSNKLFRILEVERERLSSMQVRNEALISCTDATLRVSWKSNAFAGRVYAGQIISPRFSKIVTSDGCTSIDRLFVHERPEVHANLFELVPYGWVKDRDLVNRGSVLLANLPGSHRLLFNAIFWDHRRFERFCRQPSSMAGHHAVLNGNLSHTVQVAEEMLALCRTRSYANQALGVLAALLHDAGKADEYIPNGKGGWDMSDRGKLLGHKVSVVEWIVQAVTRWNIKIAPDHYESLLHIMTAIPHAPDWMGLRQPVTPESMLLSIADRLSGHDDLMLQTVNPKGGFGRFHKHLKAAPYSVRG